LKSERIVIYISRGYYLRARASGSAALAKLIDASFGFMRIEKHMHSMGLVGGVASAMTRASICGTLFALCLLVSGCGTSSITEAEKQSLAATASAPAKLQPGDKIKVTVYGENQLSGDYQLDQSGQISLPLAGTVRAEGMTQSELEQALAKKFRSEYLKNPKVTVTISTLQPYYIMGEVEKPGEFNYRSGLNVLTALAIAGGPTYRASRSTVQIQRRGETSMRDYPISASVPVFPGDVIRVPERYF
jgi:polysaccharide biosynthesis/export protein